MRLLIDENLSPVLASALVEAGHDAIHVSDVDMRAATDTAILDYARTEDRTIVSADTDFGTLLATARSVRPSVIIVRLTTGRRIDQLAALLTEVLPRLAEETDAGAVVVLEDQRIRIRRLPLVP